MAQKGENHLTIKRTSAIREMIHYETHLCYGDFSVDYQCKEAIGRAIVAHSL